MNLEEKTLDNLCEQISCNLRLENEKTMGPLIEEAALEIHERNETEQELEYIKQDQLALRKREVEIVLQVLEKYNTFVNPERGFKRDYPELYEKMKDKYGYFPPAPTTPISKFYMPSEECLTRESVLEQLALLQAHGLHLTPDVISQVDPALHEVIVNPHGNFEEIFRGGYEGARKALDEKDAA